MERRLAEAILGSKINLCRQIHFERFGLLDMKIPEIAELRISLEAVNRLSHRIDRCLREAVRMDQEAEVLALNPFIVGVLRFHWPEPLRLSHGLGREKLSRLCVVPLVGTRRPGRGTPRQLGQGDAAMHERAALRTDCPDVSCCVGHREVVHHPTSGLPRRPTFEAKQLTWRAGLFAAQPALVQKPGQLKSMNKSWPTGIDRPEPLLKPGSNGVLADAE